MRSVFQAERWIRITTTLSVLLVAAIAAIVSYRHMHELVLKHGEDDWAAALIPLSVDGTIIAASMSLLLASRYGRSGGPLSWMLLVVSALASLGANVAVAEPTLIGRLIAAWPSFALIGAYEMLMNQIRLSVGRRGYGQQAAEEASDSSEQGAGLIEEHDEDSRWLQRAAWRWALDNCRPDGSLPSGGAIAHAFSRSPRWGRMVKRAGLVGELSDVQEQEDDPGIRQAG